VHHVVIDAFAMTQIAVAVFIGNAFTLLMVKGYQTLRDEGSTWYARGCYALPIVAAILALIGSSS
jgi:hypothetical protein